MQIRAKLRTFLSVLLVALPLVSGCGGGGTGESGPAVEPNSGPGGPPGAGKVESKSGTAPAAKPSAEPAGAPASGEKK